MMDAFADNYNYVVFLAKPLFNGGNQRMLIKRNFGKKDKIWSSSANILCQRTSRRKPAGIATHGLDKRYIFGVVDAAIAGELGSYGRNESRRATKAGGVIRAL